MIYVCRNKLTFDDTCYNYFLLTELLLTLESFQSALIIELFQPDNLGHY